MRISSEQNTFYSLFYENDLVYTYITLLSLTFLFFLKIIILLTFQMKNQKFKIVYILIEYLTYCTRTVLDIYAEKCQSMLSTPECIVEYAIKQKATTIFVKLTRRLKYWINLKIFNLVFCGLGNSGTSARRMFILVSKCL